MKTAITILILICLSFVCYSQCDTIVYRECCTSYRDSKLTLLTNGNFLYEHSDKRNVFDSYRISGEWKTEASTIVFIDTFDWFEGYFRVDSQINMNTDSIWVTVKDEAGRPVSGTEISYYYVWKGDLKFQHADSYGRIGVDRKEMLRDRAKHPEFDRPSVSVRIKRGRGYMLLGFIVDYHYNKIDITIVSNPKRERMVRNTIYTKKAGVLKFERQYYLSDRNVSLQNWGDFIQEEVK